MTYFLFIGDMLVMAFMMAVVVWVYMKSSREKLEGAAQIPLHDEGELPLEKLSGKRDAYDG